LSAGAASVAASGLRARVLRVVMSLP
jgi:hypothetical protein